MPNTDTRPELTAEIIKSSYYRKIQKIIDTLTRTGIIQRGRGSCISMSDLIKSMLEDQGIKSQMVECECTITIRYPKDIKTATPNNVVWLGHDDHTVYSQNTKDSYDVDTHMVVVTETEIPILIDASVIGMAPGIDWIAQPFQSRGDVIAELRFQHSLWVYRRKRHTRMPQHYQESIVDRIRGDQKTARNIRFLAAAVLMALVISTVNAVRGAYDFWLIYHEENNWGPKSMQELKQKIEGIEQKLNAEGK